MFRFLLLLSLLLAPACERSQHPELDVVVRPREGARGKLRLRLTGAAPTAAHGAVGAWLSSPAPGLSLQGRIVGTGEAPGGSAPALSSPLEPGAGDGPAPPDGSWVALSSRVHALPLDWQPWVWVEVVDASGAVPVAFKAQSFPDAWPGIDDYEWCEPGESGAWACASLRDAYWSKQLVCHYSTGGPTDCEFERDGARRLLVPYVFARTWRADELPPGCAAPTGARAPSAPGGSRDAAPNGGGCWVAAPQIEGEVFP